MAMSINKFWSAIIVFLIVLLSGGIFPAAPQEPSPGPPVTEEDRQLLLERLRERLQENNMQQPADRQFQGFPGQQQQPANRPFQGFPAQQQQPTPTTATPAAAPQQISLKQANGTLILSINDMDLNTFIQQISELLNLTPLVVDSEVKGNVTIHSSTPMSKEEVLALFHLILKTKNASLIKQNGIYQVVPISSALKTGVDLIERRTPEAKPETEPAAEPAQPPISRKTGRSGIAAPGSSEIPQLNINVVRVEYIPVKDLIEPIKLFMTEGGVIMPYERLNMLLLMDYSDSIDRILQIIHMLDNSYMDPDLIDLVKIEHNSSSDIVTDLQKLYGAGESSSSSTGVKFISLDRLNTIFVMAGSKRALTEVKSYIEMLDTTTGRSIQTNIYIVENSTASNIATLLSALYGGETTMQNAAGTGGQTATPGGNALLGALGGNQQQRGSFGTFSSSSSLSGGSQGRSSDSGFSSGNQQLNPQFNTSRGISSMIIQGGEFSGLQDTVRLVVDDISNRLIVQSTAADYDFILDSIQKMDVMPRQAVIDAQVYEVDLTDDLSFGVGAALRERTGGSLTEVGMNSSTTDGVATGALTAANIALIGNSQELLTALSALREKTNVKILEAPSILAMDGTEAHITVGSEIPYTGSLYYQNNSESPTQSVSYRDTGVTLSVLPHISASGSVTLELLQEVSGLGASTSLGPSFTKSRVECTLTVKDGETVAIAGLIRDSNSLTRTGFPLLSDIPIIGSLFGGTSRNNRRSELIILITPHVIKDPDKFKEFTQEFKDSMKNVRKYADDKEQQRIQNLQDAEEDRKKEEEELLKDKERQRKREERSKSRRRE